jgi:hypothetical protein
LTDKAFEITQRRMIEFPVGPLFRNSLGRPWTTEAVNCGFWRIEVKLGMRRLEESGAKLDDVEVRQFMATLRPEKMEDGQTRRKTERELIGEARRKLLQRKACQFVPNYSLYALRHTWATHALERGVDPLTVAILMGHSDPSMLAKVYQHLSLNPAHLRSQLEKAWVESLFTGFARSAAVADHRSSLMCFSFGSEIGGADGDSRLWPCRFSARYAARSSSLMRMAPRRAPMHSRIAREVQGPGPRLARAVGGAANLFKECEQNARGPD